MSEETAKTRLQEHEIEIKAPIEAVWKALTDAQELTCWFVDDAKVAPGEGGTMWLAWGEGESKMEGKARIDVWEPGKRLKLTLVGADQSGGLPFAQLEVPIVEEWTLQSRGDVTVLKLVHSNIPNSPDWDAYYDGTDSGWRAYFLALRHYLQYCPRKKRDVVLFMRPLAVSFPDAWKALTGTEGLAATGTIDGLQRGSRYSTVTALGDRLEGEIVESIPPKILMLTVDGLDQALLLATFEEMGGMSFVYLTLAIFGRPPAEVEQIRSRWIKWLGELLPAAEAPLSPDIKPLC
ncbi:MAG TPA: SRPBCC domain-containing protein [Blastocatellia bacterium]